MSSAYSQTKLILDGLLELLACGKCKKTPTRPMRYINCEHFFCYACMYGETICFKCKIPLSPHDIRPCRMVDQLIDYCQIVKNAIAEIKSEDLKTLSKAIRVFTTQSNGVVPETDSESEDDVVESTPPGQRSSQKKNTQLETSGCLAPKRLNMDQGTEELVPDDKEYVDASRLHSHQGKQDSVPETAGYISATQLSPHRRKNDVQPETAGFVDPTQFSPHQRKQNLQPETAGFIDPTQLSPHQRKRNIQPETAGFVSPQFSPHQRKQNCELETAGFVSPTQFSLHQRKQNLEPESAGFVSPTQFSPHQRKQNLEPETAGFVSPTQFSPRIRKQNLQPETAGFVSPTQFSPRIRKQNLQPETAGFVSPTQFSPRIRKQNLQPETAGFVSPTQFSPRIRKQNLQPETAGFVSPTQFSPRIRKQNLQPETAGFVSPTQFSPRIRKQNLQPETAGFVSPTQFSPDQRKHDFEPETAGFVDPTQFSPHPRKQNIDPDREAYADPGQLSQSHCKSDLEPETAGYLDGMQTPPSRKKKRFRSDTCKFLTLRTRQRRKTLISESPGSYVDPTQRDPVENSDSNRADQCVDGNSSVAGPAGFIDSPLGNNDDSAIGQPTDARRVDPTRRDQTLDGAASVKSAANFVNPVDKRAEVNSQPVTVGHRDPTEITRCPTNADFLESAEIFDSAPGVRRHREIDVQHKVPETNSCERVDGKEKTVGLQESSVFQESNTDLVLAPESMEVREITSKKVFISESPENDEKAPSCRNSPMEIDNDCMEKSSPTKFSRDQDASTISVVVDKTTKSAAIREETPFEKLKRIKSLALKRLRKIRQISQDCTKPIETDTREKSSGKKRSIEEDASHDGREKKSSTEPDHTSVSTGQTFGDETDGFVQKTPKRLRRTRNPSSEEQHLPLHFRNANTAKTIDSNATTVEIEQEIRSAMDTRQRDNDNEKFVIGHETRFDPVNGRTESSGREKVQKCVQQLRSVENLDNEAHTRKCEEQLMQLKSRRDIDKSRSAGSKSVPKNVNKRNAKGETTLHTACVKGQADYVKTLLEAGANPNTKDNANWTPLQEAVNLGHREICKMLLQAGASANTPAMDNRTALHEAAENNRLEEATLLLRFNANKNVYDKFGKKPIDYAVSEEMRTLLADETKIDAIIDNDLYVEPALDQSIIIPNAKVIVLPSHLSSQNRKLLAQLAFKLKVEVATTFRSTVTHVVVETNDRNITELTYDVMLAILQGKWILNSQWITISTDLNDISDIDLEMFEVRGAPNPETPTRARINEEKQNPRLFNNCFFYFAIGPRCTWSYEKFEFTKESLTTLVLGGQGEILNREPDPEDVKDYKLTPFHVAHKPIHPLYRCSHYIIYMPGKDEPRVKYNMPHIKSLPVGWFLECIEKFTLVDPVLMGITVRNHHPHGNEALRPR